MDQAEKLEIKDMYMSGVSVAQISEATGFHKATIYLALNSMGVDTSLEGTRVDKLSDEEVKDIVDMYDNPHIKLTVILTKYKLQYGQLYALMDAMGKPRREKRQSFIDNMAAMKDYACKLYTEGYKMWEIKDATGFDAGKIYATLRERGIKTRKQAYDAQWDGVEFGGGK